MALQCGGKVGLVFLVVINILFSLMGLGLLIAGALALSDVGDVNTDHVKPLLDTIEVGSFQAGNMATNLSILLIVIGVFILIVSGLGLFGACCQSKCTLVVYAIIVLILLLMKIVIIVLWFTMKDKVESEIKAKMLTALYNNYKDDTITNSNSVSNAWNYMFMTLDCCAVNSVTGTTNDFDNTAWCTTSGTCQATSSEVPKTCCLGVTESTYSSAPAACHQNVDSGTYNSKGCYEALKDKLLSRSPSIMGVSITIILLEILAVIFAFLVCSQSGDRTSGLSDVAKS